MFAILASLIAAASTVTPIRNGNALTLPAARHVVRVDPGDGAPAAWLLAVQQDGANGHGLGFFRSDDEGRTFHWYAPIQDDWSERSTADLIAVGRDVAVVYSFEGPVLSGSARHDVWFQWWRYSAGEWRPQPAVRVLDSGSAATAYSRALVARDSHGRLWVQAFRLESDGGSTAMIAVSGDGGSNWDIQAPLDRLSNRGGGRLISVGSKLLFFYSSHGCCPAGRLRMRDDGDPIDHWTAAVNAVPDGLYHGAALSAVADGQGGLHLVYKNHAEQLLYRRFDGTSFGAARVIEGHGDWALQPATTRVGSRVYLFYNYPIVTDLSYEFRVRTIDGSAISGPRVLDPQGSFQGYPGAAAVLTEGAAVPCFFGKTPTANGGPGTLMKVFAEAPPANPPPPPPPPDPTPTPSAGVLFTDDFNRTAAGDLGNHWMILSGQFRTDARANSNTTAEDQAAVRDIACADCRIDVRAVGFAVPDTAIFLRSDSRALGDRYDLNLDASGNLQIRRWRGGAATVLAQAASGVDRWSWARFSFEVKGDGPVTLTGWANGVQRVQVVDSSAAAIGHAGLAGIYTTRSGVWFDDFVLTGLASSSPPPPPPPPPPPQDGGTPDDGGSPPPPGELFSDDFNRMDAAGLGPEWEVLAGGFRTDARANSNAGVADQAAVRRVSCADCRIDVRAVGFKVPETAVFLRAADGRLGDRYDLTLTSTGALQIRRWRSGAATVLATAPSGIADLTNWARISFEVAGAGPVTLKGYVGGAQKIAFVDTEMQAISAAGRAGIYTTRSGVWFDDFVLTATGP